MLSDLANFDIVIITLLSLSTIFGLFKGVIKSSIYFACWIISAYLVIIFYQDTTTFLKKYIQSDLVIEPIATLGLYILLLICTTLVSSKIIDLMKDIRGGLLDLSFGLAFGFFRGCVIGCVLFWSIVTLTTMWDEDVPKWLKESKSYTILNLGTDYLISFITNNGNNKVLLKVLNKKEKFTIKDTNKIFDNDSDVSDNNPEQEALDTETKNDKHTNLEIEQDMNHDLKINS